MISVLLVDDQAVIRTGLRNILESADMTIVGEADNGTQGFELTRELRPNIVLMDLRMPGKDGVSAIKEIRADVSLEAVHILVLTTFDGDRDVVTALSAGADGFLSKTAEPDEIIDVVETVSSGEPSLSARASRAVLSHLSSTPDIFIARNNSELAVLLATLTPREHELVTAAAHGENNATIAERLSISPLTVKTHLNRAMAKLGVHDRGELVALAYRGGVV